MRVAVIGGSVAGLEAAIQLAGDCEVVVYEEHEKIGLPVRCGEGFIVYENVTPYGGVVRRINRAVFRRIELPEFRVREEVVTKTYGSIFMVDRPVMEREMAKIARKKGAEIITGRRVKIKEIVDDFDLIVDASGYPSQWCREFGGRRGGGVAVQAFAKCDLDEMVIDISKSFDGYFWVFPKDAGYANIGVGYNGRKLPKLRQWLEKYLEILGAEPVSWTGGLIGYRFNRPFLREYRKTPIALIGDAAGLVDPYLGEGITKAIISARILARNIKNGTPENYEREYLSALRWSYTTSWTLYYLRRLSPTLLFKIIRLISNF
jgi:flavin-dependent dehydrogenase